jgi:ketosteroid isomerase-like protein
MTAASATADGALRVVCETFAAWMARDLERMAAGLADDFVQWHSHIRRDFSKLEHQALLRQVLGAGTLTYHHVTYLSLQGGVLVRCLCDIRMNDGANADDVPFAMIFRVRNGKIFRCDEYMDGLALPKMPFVQEPVLRGRRRTAPGAR